MDTVVLKIQGLDKYRVMDRTLWVPELMERRTYKDLTANERRSKYQYLRHFILRPKRTAFYQPRVELYEKLSKDGLSVQYDLKLEFSIPKLLYGNSMIEAHEATKEEVFSALITALSRISVVIEAKALENAYVSGVHFCKNILLPVEMRMQEVLTELARMDINKSVDITRKDFKHGGQMLQIYAGTREHVFYDKVADAARPKVKRTDKGHIGKERAFVERCGLEKREIFRYEYRLKIGQTVRRDINLALARDQKTTVVFGDLFTPGLPKTVIQTSWRTLLTRPENQLALIGDVGDLGLLAHIITEARKQGTVNSMNRAFISYGLVRAIRDFGAKEVRRAVFGAWNSDHSERLTEKLKTAAGLTGGLPYSNSIAFIDAELERYPLMTRLSLVLAV